MPKIMHNGKNYSAPSMTNGTNNASNYGTCSTAAHTAAKVVDCPGFELADGVGVTVRFNFYDNTAANPELNVNKTGAYPVYYRGNPAPAEFIAKNSTLSFRYHASIRVWELVGYISGSTGGTAVDTFDSFAYRDAIDIHFYYVTGDLVLNDKDFLVMEFKCLGESGHAPYTVTPMLSYGDMVSGATYRIFTAVGDGYTAKNGWVKVGAGENSSGEFGIYLAFQFPPNTFDYEAEENDSIEVTIRRIRNP